MIGLAIHLQDPIFTSILADFERQGIPKSVFQLHHFIAAGVWDATPVETELLVQADRLTGTGGLSGLRGEGGFEGEFGRGSDGTLDYWFE